jgi:hypothetical protein
MRSTDIAIEKRQPEYESKADSEEYPNQQLVFFRESRFGLQTLLGLLRMSVGLGPVFRVYNTNGIITAAITYE